MAIQPLEQRLDQMVSTPEPQEVNPLVPGTPEPAMPAMAQEEEPVQVAGVGRLGLEILQGLTKKGAKAEKVPKLVDEAAGVKAPTQPIPPAPEGATKPVATPVAPEPKKPAAVRPVDVTEMNRVAAERERMLAEGETVARPPETPISTAWTTDDELAATIRSAAESVVQQEPTMSVRSIYMKAVNAGVPEQFLQRTLAGESMEATVGGSQLAQKLAGAVVVHDESAKKVDDLMTKMAAGELDDNGKLQLRLQLAQHQIIVQQLKGVQTDIARSMNVFKRVKDKGPGLNTRDIRAALDELGANQSDVTLYRLAVDYLDTPSRAGKNRVLEAGLGAKMRDVWFHTYQANLLNSPTTHAYNFVGSSVFGALAPLERSIASGFGKLRQVLPNANPDRYEMQDVLAGLSGVKNGMLDGWELAKEAIKRGGDSKFSDPDRPLNPLSADFLSDTPVRLFGQEVYRTPDLRDTFLGRAIDGIGFVQDALSFRPIAAADEFVGAVVGRYQLHEEAWRYANKEYDRLIAEGMEDAAARAEVQAKVGQLLTERPREMQESVDGMRRMVTLQDTIAKEGALGETYFWANQILNLPPAKIFVPFAKTIANLFNEGSSYVPLLNTLSPRFYDLWSKGGRHRDVAMARLSMGGSAVATTAMLTLDNRLTGSGPSQTQDRQALQALGWQPYSLVFSRDEISPENLERLRGITDVAVGPDKVYVSYARFDPISMVFAMGADMGDAAKFDRHPDRSDFEVMAMAGMTATAEYMGNLPVMQFVGEMLSIARSRSEDGGERVVQAFDTIGRYVANFVYTGTPAVGMTNSTVVAQIERIIDPTIRSAKSPEMDTPPGLRAYYEARQRIMSRIPGVSANVPPELDNLGRERTVKNRGLDYWANWSPVVQATEGKTSAADEVLVSLNFGISNPSETWDGVRLSGPQINRFKRLYGQEIKMDMVKRTTDPKTGEVFEEEVMVNLEEAIPIYIENAEIDAMEVGTPLLKGDKQALIQSLVSQYRQAARLQMVGDPSAAPGELDFVPEFPELAAAMQRNRELQRMSGR